MRALKNYPDLEGKVAIVTGSASGIGKRTSELFAKNGVNVFGIDLQNHSVTNSSRKNKFKKADLTKSEEVKGAVDECLKRFHKLDIVVNCAGIEMRGTVVELDEEKFDMVMRTNVRSIFLVSKYSIPHLLKRRGTIINLSSDLGISPVPATDAYAASKGAIISLTKAMSKNWAKQGVRINCIAPGPIDTPLLHRFVPDEQLRVIQNSMIPMGRLGTPEDVAKVIMFLASGESSSFVNGAVYTVNGGLV